jgi:hypothetical protein
MTPFPILLWMKPVPDPFIHFSMVKDSRYTAIQFFQYLAFQLQEVDVKIDQQFLIRALNWWTEFSPVLSSRNGTFFLCLAFVLVQLCTLI